MSFCALFFFAVLLRDGAVADPVPLIIDTDIGGGGCQDVDDVGAICMAHALAQKGEADILAVVHNTQPVMCAGVISVLNHYYGRDDIPIGAYKGGGLSDDSPFLPYVPDLVNNFPSPIKNNSQVPDSVTVYRKILASQKDRSVAIASIGLMTNLEALLKSPPDTYSPLNGTELVRQKVKLISAMAGRYPQSGPAAECNMCGCYNGADKASASTAEHASAFVYDNMPSEVEVVFNGFEVGFQVQTGAALSSCATEENPCRQAYINYEHGPNRSRYSWDLMATLYAVRGTKGISCHLCDDCDGKNSVDPNSGRNEWIAGPKSNQSYVVLDDAKAAVATIEELLCEKPNRKSTST
eukprot:m.175554 g.175554  ORF g.175554 m.175554 type:complete len:352 (+) comp15429_c2_seq3:222-1277(+)